jgi:FKBP-type peptidyl-prolyl cis-trans isomerase FklB
MRKKTDMARMLAVLTSLALVPVATFAGEGFSPKDDQDIVSYSIGYQVGGDFRRQGIEIDPASLVRGVQDALAGAEPGMTPQEMHATLRDLQQKIADDQEKQRKAALRQNLDAGRAFMEVNASKPGVTTLPSGLQYQVIEEGEGASPKITDTVTVHYRGTLIDGAEFDSSYRRGQPATFQLNRVIKGWTEGVQLMKPGAKYTFFVPPDLAYGERGGGAKIPPNSTLIFEVELQKVGQ